MIKDLSKSGRVVQLLHIARSIEWPTIVLAMVIHAAWLIVTLEHKHIGLPALIVMGGWITAWHGSLQHEVIHGHPTPWRRVNLLFAAAPVSFWLPFESYRQTHIDHHATDHLTDPGHDPESRYLPNGKGVAFRIRYALTRLQSSLLGRMVVGPPVEIAIQLFIQARAVVRDDAGARTAWMIHAMTLAPLLLWLHLVCQLSLVRYGLCFIYPGAALSLLRSFAEHRADHVPGRRVAVVEHAPVLGLLFLNNNLHAAHHAWPGAPWFELRQRYALHRQQLLEANGGLVYFGYGEVVRRFLLRAHDQIGYLPALARTEWPQP